MHAYMHQETEKEIKAPNKERFDINYKVEARVIYYCTLQKNFKVGNMVL